MPWKIEAGEGGWFVVNAETGKRMNKEPHKTRKAALAQQRALYVHAPESRGKEAADPAVHNGAMVALYPPIEIARKLAVAGGLPADDMHLTLAFLGDADAIDAAGRQRAELALRALALESPMLDATVNGLGRFMAHAENDNKECVIALIDSLDLPALRQKVVEALAKEGVPLPSAHGFLPHMTLSYVTPGAGMAMPPLMTLQFRELHLVWGKEHITIPLQSNKDDAPLLTKEITERPDISAADKKRALSEYGDVTFADPKNKKYPIDTSAHIHAAWNYINKPKNAAKYSASEVAAIKGRIVAAWKKKVDPKGPPSLQEKEVAANATGVPAHGPGGLMSSFGMGHYGMPKRKKKKRQVVKEFVQDVVDRLAGRQPEPDALDHPVSVFKDSDGKLRWLLISSNAFRDRDHEIVSTKALANDVERSDASGAYGPLRWWHFKGAELGDCDYRALFGRMLVESGTFRDDRVAEKIKEKSHNLRVSIGFTHPANEPDANGVFHNITVFERSLVPVGRAANDYTLLTVKGD